MATPGSDAAEILCREILADARSEGEEIVRQARQQAEALLAQAAIEAEQGRQRRLEQARAEASRRREAILATVPVEVGRIRAAQIEAALESLHQEARNQLFARAGFDYGETLVRLAAEALQRMDGEAFVLKLPAGDRLAADQVRRRAGRSPLALTIVEDPAITGGGVIVQDVAGRQVWDNRLAARLDRLWPELRRQIAARIGVGP